MRIGRRGRIGTDLKELRAALDEILKFEECSNSVCGAACQRPDPRNCSRSCPDIPRILSSDPEKFPLETRIAPLVYELKRLGVFEPCWSCEGHDRPDGSFWKRPQVWFYAHSVVHLRVLADGIKELHLRKMLSVPWKIAVTFSDSDNAETTFSLRPRIDHSNVTLASLQNDVDAIASALHAQVLAEALKLSRQFGSVHG
jgi:hypothetical protein